MSDMQTPAPRRRWNELGVIALVVVILIGLRLGGALLTNNFNDVFDNIVAEVINLALWAAPFICAILFGLFVKDQTGRRWLAILLGIIIYFAVSGFISKLSNAGYLPDNASPVFKYEWNYKTGHGSARTEEKL